MNEKVNRVQLSTRFDLDYSLTEADTIVDVDAQLARMRECLRTIEQHEDRVIEGLARVTNTVVALEQQRAAMLEEAHAHEGEDSGST